LVLERCHKIRRDATLLGSYHQFRLIQLLGKALGEPFPRRARHSDPEKNDWTSRARGSILSGVSCWAASGGLRQVTKNLSSRFGKESKASKTPFRTLDRMAKILLNPELLLPSSGLSPAPLGTADEPMVQHFFRKSIEGALRSVINTMTKGRCGERLSRGKVFEHDEQGICRQSPL